ncbi:energy-coupling factor transporter transmembrane component T family protein [Bacillus salipaludis]|uniref:Energy-coupling factor transporter transmembrane component T family protein n=1 Tax=Bacillus salipaludis TaxID=2547811 RepID=A0ABW8RHG1_9BACI
MDYDFAYSFKKPQLTGNWLLDFNPLSKLNILLASSLVPILAYQWQVSVGFILFYFVLAAVAGRFTSFAKMYLKLGLLIGLFLFLIRAVFVQGETSLVKLWFVNITKEGIDQGIGFSTVVLAVFGAIVLSSLIIKAKDLVYSLEKKGAPHSTSYIVLASLQSIIDLGQGAKLIMDSQRARGIETEGNIWKRIQAFVPTLGPLFLSAIAGTEEKAIALDARAFSAPVKNTHLCDLRPVPIWEKVIVVMVDLAFIGFLVWRIVTWIA